MTKIPSSNLQKGKLNCFFASFSGSNTSDIINGADENLPVSNFTGFGSVDDGIDSGGNLTVRQNNFDLDLREKIDGIFAAAIDFRVALLAAETFHFTHGHSFNSNTSESFFDVFELKRFDNSLDFLHRFCFADTNNHSVTVNRNLNEKADEELWMK